MFEKPSNRTRHSMEMAVSAARRSPGLHARRRGRLRHPRAGRGRGPDPGGLPRGDRRPGVRPPVLDPDGRRGRRARGQHALGPLAPAAGLRRRADDAAVSGRPGRATVAWSATTTTWPARSARSRRSSACTSASPVRTGSTPPTPSSNGSCLLGAASVEQSHRPVEAVEGAHAVHTDTWVSMGQEADKAATHQQFEGYRSTPT
jgi:hypothetical protein